jgi:transposase-like protein
MSHIAHLSDYPRLCERIQTLVREGYNITHITALLAHEGFRSPTHARPFSRQSVIELMRRLGVHQPRRHRRPPLQAHEWWLSDLERELGKSNSTLHQWRKRGWLHARGHDQGKRWVVWANAAELRRLKQRSALPAGEVSRQMWLDAQRSHLIGIPPVTEIS